MTPTIHIYRYSERERVEICWVLLSFKFYSEHFIHVKSLNPHSHSHWVETDSAWLLRQNSSTLCDISPKWAPDKVEVGRFYSGSQIHHLGKILKNLNICLPLLSTGSIPCLHFSIAHLPNVGPEAEATVMPRTTEPLPLGSGWCMKLQQLSQ